ncbi:kinase-like protein [Xylariaceae sp. AK1471]|nr:kinase-like protein [Xylariaceae sp. AK1471]
MTHDVRSLGIESSQDGNAESWNYKNVPIMDEVEDLEGYRPGGFAPVTIGDILADRFQIIYKLGFGGIAMVWLCWELATEKWWAVKINAASHSSEDCGDLKAIRLMQQNGLDQKQLDENHITMAFETFWEETLNGRHLCTVLPVLGPRAHDWRTEELKLETERVRSVCYQITKGLSFLHSNGLVHGDFRPQNVLMKLKPGSLDNLTRDDMWDLLGEPEEADVWTTSGKRSRHAPVCVVTSAPWQRFRDFVIDEVAIVDFGEAYIPSNPPRHFGIPNKYAAPEVLFEKGRPGLAGDIWSLGITLLELRLDDYGCDAPITIIRKMERFVGPIPIGYRYAARKLLENDGWEGDINDFIPLRPLTGPVEIPLDRKEEQEFCSATFSDRLEMKLASEQWVYGEEPDPRDPSGKTMRPALIRYYLPDEEVRDLAELLHRMLRYDATDRISASQVLRHRWFRNQRAGKRVKPWKLFLAAVLSLLFLVCVSWIWKAVPWSSGEHNQNNSSEPPRWVESCAVTILYLSTQ